VRHDSGRRGEVLGRVVQLAALSLRRKAFLLYSVGRDLEVDSIRTVNSFFGEAVVTSSAVDVDNNFILLV
jgi:hypothetical protein